MIEQATFDPGLRGATIDVAGPENLSFDQVVDVVREVTGVEGKVDHVPPVMLRLMSVVLRPFKPVLAGQIGAAVVMDSARHDRGLDRAREAVPVDPGHEAQGRRDAPARQQGRGDRAMPAPMSSR